MNGIASFLVCLFLFVWIFSGPMHDDSDSPSAASNFRVYTDYKTGCQYLVTMWGSVTPRFDHDGKIVCVTEGQTKP